MQQNYHRNWTYALGITTLHLWLGGSPWNPHTWAFGEAGVCKLLLVQWKFPQPASCLSCSFRTLEIWNGANDREGRWWHVQHAGMPLHSVCTHWQIPFATGQVRTQLRILIISLVVPFAVCCDEEWQLRLRQVALVILYKSVHGWMPRLCDKDVQLKQKIKGSAAWRWLCPKIRFKPLISAQSHHPAQIGWKLRTFYCHIKITLIALLIFLFNPQKNSENGSSAHHQSCTRKTTHTRQAFQLGNLMHRKIYQVPT